VAVGIDGGYVRAQGKQGWLEVIAGKSLQACMRGEESKEPISSQCFAFGGRNAAHTCCRFGRAS
jgi:hypothetical protein